MDEIIVRVLRTVACSARLRIFTCLAREVEVSPTHLARKLEMGTDLVSAHLTRLSSAGLITRRRSGVRCHCTAESPYPPDVFSGRITLWLTEAVGRPRRAIKDGRMTRLQDSDPADPDSELHKVLIDAATAFTNVRRVQIVRCLTAADSVAVETLTKELGMSESAVSRHTSKLIRRGYVDAGRAGRCLEFRLAGEFKTPLHASLMAIVRSQWEERELRS